uniref:Methanolan biosynthesis EpsI domain-containing protein n=1 Tax=Solibacter usitatus (strain Ellin6076) TaxID=234267 RepID=Q01XJ3_SOLUE
MTVRTPRLMAGAACILAIQATGSYWFQRDPYLPAPPPLAALPLHLGDWNQLRDSSVDPDALAALAPDDSLVREYQFGTGSETASVFVAYYKTQLRAKNAHDPKVCLPGSGWNPTVSRVIAIPALQRSGEFPVNYYRIVRDGSQAVVIYWFQTYNGVYTFEQQLRAHRLLDAVLENRTDMALVRIVMPIGEVGVQAADTRATELAQLLYPQMFPYFPSKEKAGS